MGSKEEFIQVLQDTKLIALATSVLSMFREVDIDPRCHYVQVMLGLCENMSLTHDFLRAKNNIA